MLLMVIRLLSRHLRAALLPTYGHHGYYAHMPHDLMAYWHVSHNTAHCWLLHNDLPVRNVGLLDYPRDRRMHGLHLSLHICILLRERHCETHAVEVVEAMRAMNRHGDGSDEETAIALILVVTSRLWHMFTETYSTR